MSESELHPTVAARGRRLQLVFTNAADEADVIASWFCFTQRNVLALLTML